MKRGTLSLIVVLGLGLGLFFLQRSAGRRDTPLQQAAPPTVEAVSTNVTAVTATSPVTENAGAHVSLLGETILQGYADANRPPEHDLTLMSHLMDNALLLLKSAANRPLSANQDWADLFRGRNGAQERFLPDRHLALNTNGELIDRWGTPLFFHALGGGRYEIRSAGPDRKLWTADDIHRNADGSFRRGSELTSPNLFEAANRQQSPSATH